MSELDALTRLATLGTANAPEPGNLSGVEAQTLRALEGLPLERRVLLAAGVRAVVRAAGHPLASLQEREGMAAPETLEVCSPRVVSVLLELLGSNDVEVLREAFEQMARAHRRLPPELLPAVLGLQEGPLRTAVGPVLGERGRWLARFNPKWHTAQSTQASSLAEAEYEWTDGSPESRRVALDQARGKDPARARAWLQGTWAQDKAEHRARFLACFDRGLSMEDEPLLEQGLKDRASSVREVARYLLARLPGSAFAQRMARRARAVVALQKPSTLQVQFPATWDDEAERDGLDKPPSGVGQSEHWLIRLLECVPLSSWEGWFEATPMQILVAAAHTEHGLALSEGWAHAFRLGPSSAWASALLGYWSHQVVKGLEPEHAQSLAVTVLEQLPPAERAKRALHVLNDHKAIPALDRILAVTPAPWPVELGQGWYQAMRAQSQMSARATAIFGTLRQASISLPPECLAAASEPFDLTGDLAYWNQALQRFQRTVSLRRILYEELKP